MRDPPWCVTNLTSIPHNHPNPQTHTRTTARRARSRPSQRSLCLLACTEPRGRPPWRPTQKRPPPAIAYIRFVVQVVIGRSTFISAAFDLNPLDASFHDETSSILRKGRHTRYRPATTTRNTAFYLEFADQFSCGKPSAGRNGVQSIQIHETMKRAQTFLWQFWCRRPSAHSSSLCALVLRSLAGGLV